ncbi:MAG TPA: phosphotransferase [Acidimicrobiales bacterium]|nr:phosphotransferase [Acidimicrobiales bacterium]
MDELVAEDLPEPLLGLIGPYLARQRWYAGEGSPVVLKVVSSGRLGQPRGAASLLWAVVDADGCEYQLVISKRPGMGLPEILTGHEEALIGSSAGWRCIDATVDPEMALVLLEAASGGAERAERARPLVAEQSNSSVIYDDRLILKVFRRLSMGANPDVEVTSALAATGFKHVAKPIVRWQRDGRDLAFGQQYLAGGTDGWALALTSLRDFYGATEKRAHPGRSGGDFAAEAARLGQVTGEMHLAMATAYPTSEELGHTWAELVGRLEAQVERLVPELATSGRPLFDRLHEVKGPGLSVRTHGDFHLGQVMRTDAGWYVLDFEGEPNRPLEQRLCPTSVMKDVAGMLRSLQYASRFALGERSDVGSADLEARAEAWEERNSAAFMHGYYETSGIERLLPPSRQDREAVRVAFELEKALYEVEYERSFRPDWARIPMAALRRLLSQPVQVLLSRPAEALGVPDVPANADV